MSNLFADLPSDLPAELVEVLAENDSILITGCDAAIKERQPMRLDEWEVTIKKIADECLYDQQERSEERILKKWRMKLEKEPTLLKPYEIDKIVRAVRARLGNASR